METLGIVIRDRIRQSSPTIVIQNMILDFMWRSWILTLASQDILRDFCKESGALGCTRSEQDYQHIYLTIANIGK